ncbi:MAG: TrfB-related DNA-binding protein [Alphaproteobacteria bacterium]|nr:TrfB-related DNA-binding protein [Alphaproteobacteria bacterium]
MDFKKATDVLCDGVTHQELAEALGVSLASVRQARLGKDAKAHRAPPAGWERAALKLAEARAKAIQKLIDQLRDVG